MEPADYNLLFRRFVDLSKDERVRDPCGVQQELQVEDVRISGRCPAAELKNPDWSVAGWAKGRSPSRDVWYRDFERKP